MVRKNKEGKRERLKAKEPLKERRKQKIILKENVTPMRNYDGDGKERR